MTNGSSEVETHFGAFDYQHATVGDAMRQEVIYCPPETPLRAVARIMAQDRIHCVLVGDDRGWSLVSDRDLLRAADGDLDKVCAGEVAAVDVPTAGIDESLDRVRRLMIEEDAAHVLVVDSRTGRPLGVLSTLDIAAMLA